MPHETMDAEQAPDPDLLRFVEALAVADARHDHAAELAARRAPPPFEAVEVTAEPIPERP